MQYNAQQQALFLQRMQPQQFNSGMINQAQLMQQWQMNQLMSQQSGFGMPRSVSQPMVNNFGMVNVQQQQQQQVQQSQQPAGQFNISSLQALMQQQQQALYGRNNNTQNQNP